MARNATMVPWMKWCLEWNKPGLLSLERYMATSSWLTWGSEDGVWFLYLSNFGTKSSLAREDCHIHPVTSYGEPLATWLEVQTFGQVVSMSALQTQGHGFDSHCGYECYKTVLYHYAPSPGIIVVIFIPPTPLSSCENNRRAVFEAVWHF